jgi:hypothetical protein
MQEMPPEFAWKAAMKLARKVDPELVGLMDYEWTRMQDQVRQDAVEKHARVVQAVAEGTYRTIDKKEVPPKSDGALVVLIPPSDRSEGFDGA